MPNWLWFLIGVATGLVWLGSWILFFWWRVISREPQPPTISTEIDRVIVRDIGTLTYSRRN